MTFSLAQLFNWTSIKTNNRESTDQQSIHLPINYTKKTDLEPISGDKHEVDAMNLWDGVMVYLGQLFTGNSMVASDLGENGVVKSMFALFFTNTVDFVRFHFTS